MWKLSDMEYAEFAYGGACRASPKDIGGVEHGEDDERPRLAHGELVDGVLALSACEPREEHFP